MNSVKKNQFWLLLHVASISSLMLLCTLPGISEGTDCPEPCPSDLSSVGAQAESHFHPRLNDITTPTPHAALPLERMVAVVRGPAMSDDMDDLGMDPGMSPDVDEFPAEVVIMDDPGLNATPVSASASVPASETVIEIPGIPVAAAVSADAPKPVWLRPVTMFGLSYGLYLLIGILRKKYRKLANSETVVGLTLVAGALFGVGTYMMQGAEFVEALEMTAAGPLAIAIHEVSKRLLGIDLGAVKS